MNENYEESVTRQENAHKGQQSPLVQRQSGDERATKREHSPFMH